MNEIPQGKFRRSAIGSKTAVQVGGKLLGYYAKRPFLSDKGKDRAKKKMEEESAAIVFNALSILKGTAVKIAQMLSIEMDIFPDSVCRELAKSYNQLPPMNQALVRKTVGNAFHEAIDTVFKSFDTRAFAAASLGQVHRAVTGDNVPLAVKVQYPGIGKSIKADMQLLRNILRPMAEYDMILPALEEIEQRLAEEINYTQEVDNIKWFAGQVPEKGFYMPEVKKEFCTDTVLSMTLLKGVPLNDWLKTDPSRDARDTIARRLHDFFLHCFYELNCIHADPNPGNFLIDKDLNVGVVDFGCVRHFDPEFVAKYRRLIRALSKKDSNTHMHMFREFDLLKGELDPSSEKILKETVSSFSDWYGQLVAEPVFDFSANPNFMKSAKAISQNIFKMRQHFKANANFVYLDRTRYGMLRLFEQLGARVRIANKYES